MSVAVPEEYWKPYASEVWMEFTKRSGVPERIMSPAEWWALRGWLLAGVPLRVVLTAMKETKGRPLSLTYYRPSVQQEWERVSRALGGM